MRVGIEVGGTFTDLMLLSDDGRIVATTKVLSTPDNPARAVLTALDEIIDLAGDDLTLLHGSTVATNAVLERKGAATGLLTTAGFADILDLQRQDRERIYELQYRKPEPLVPRSLVGQINERTTAGGEVLHAIDRAQAKCAIRELVDAGVTSIAICLLHSYAHPRHEQALRALIHELHPGVQISISSEVVAEFREYERASTTVIDAFVKPVIHAYLSDLQTESTKRGVSNLLMMQSNGGLLPASYIREHPGRTLFSGPAAGVTGAIRVAREAGIANIITIDMGGTSTDVCQVTDGSPEMTGDAMIDRLPVRIPMIDIVTVGAGGGSIAWLDPGGMLQVGPQSAGADPGPACYGFGGTRATVTDANVARGLIRPGHFLDGAFELDVAAAQTAVSEAAGRINRSAPLFAEDVCTIANVTMANAVRLVSTERGYDPRDYTLVAYGGAGPLHAASVAEQLNVNRVLVPPFPGLISAYGLLAGQFQRDFARTLVSPLDDASVAGAPDMFKAMVAAAHHEVAGYGIDADSCAVTFGLDLRYRGQGFELMLPVSPGDFTERGPDHLAARFHDQHRLRYGHATPGEPVEVVTYRLSLTQPFDSPATLRATSEAPRQAEQAPITVDGESILCDFHWRPSTPAGFSADGPLVIEEPTATTFVPPGWRMSVDRHSNLAMEKKP